MLKFSPIGGNNGISDYGAMSAVMTCYQQLAAQTGAHVALLHHHAKGGDSATRSTLGSQAIDGAVDSILDLTKTADDVRYLKVRGRGASMPKTRIDVVDGWAVAGVTAKAETARSRRADLLAVIRSRPGELSRTGVVTEAGMKRAEGLSLIATMIEDRVIHEVEAPNDARRRTIRFAA